MPFSLITHCFIAISSEIIEGVFKLDFVFEEDDRVVERYCFFCCEDLVELGHLSILVLVAEKNIIYVYLIDCLLYSLNNLGRDS